MKNLMPAYCVNHKNRVLLYPLAVAELHMPGVAERVQRLMDDL